MIEKRTMSPATQSALIRGASEALSALRAERAALDTAWILNRSAAEELDRRIEDKRGQLARARKGQF
jgi:hypothetical protein